MINTFRANSNSLTFLFYTLDGVEPILFNSVGSIEALGTFHNYVITPVNDGSKVDVYPTFLSDEASDRLPVATYYFNGDSEFALDSRGVARIFCQLYEDLSKGESIPEINSEITRAVCGLFYSDHTDGSIKIYTSEDLDTYEKIYYIG